MNIDNFETVFKSKNKKCGFAIRVMMSKDEIKKAEILVGNKKWFKGYDKGYVIYSFTKEIHDEYNDRK